VTRHSIVHPSRRRPGSKESAATGRARPPPEGSRNLGDGSREAKCWHRRHNGKSDPRDAESTAWAVMVGKTAGEPKSVDACVEMIRAFRDDRANGAEQPHSVQQVLVAAERCGELSSA
jgi:hypothetical protein